MMRALTLWQPYASLIAMGVKVYETRSWGTAYRGDLVIHAAAKRDQDVLAAMRLPDIRRAFMQPGIDTRLFPPLDAQRSGDSGGRDDPRRGGDARAQESIWNVHRPPRDAKCRTARALAHRKRRR